jgi:hypothetical protein
MSFRRDAILRSGGFTHGLGRVGSVPLGCEETELALRLTRAAPGSVIIHAPRARVEHRVPPERASWRYFCSRCWAEGLSKAAVSRMVGRGGALSSERHYVSRTLPAAVVRELGSALRGDGAGLRRAVVICAGLAITAAGYVRGCLAGLGSSGSSGAGR